MFLLNKKNFFTQIMFLVRKNFERLNSKNFIKVKRVFIFLKSINFETEVSQINYVILSSDSKKINFI
jgi:hypothetical protein